MIKIFQKLQKAFQKTRSFLGKKIGALFGKPLNEETFEELQQILYEADLGSEIATLFTEHLRKFLKTHPESSTKEILKEMEREAKKILDLPSTVSVKSGNPLVFLIVGINGSGKTTSIAKLAKLFQSQGKSVLIGAGDTFRAAAIEQLQTWAERLKVDFVGSKAGSDPASVAFDALTAAKARGIDVVLIDTAGRLQNKTDLMQELAKIRRTCQKVIPDSPHETLLILDANVGQNGLNQATTFHEFTPLTSILLSKLDGSAKGGIVLAIYKKLKIPIRWIGVGESVDDLIEFNKEAYVSELFSEE